METSEIEAVIQKAVNRIVAEVGEHRLFSPDMPEWLFNLPPGIYTVNDLIKISGRKRRNVSHIMKKYCQRVEYVESAKSHLKKCIYYWD